MNKLLSDMNNTELRQYLSEHRHDEEAFSQALEILLSRKKDLFKSWNNEDWDKFDQLIEDCLVDTGIEDLAHQHDHLLWLPVLLGAI